MSISANPTSVDERRQLDTDLVLDQCDRLHGLRRLVGELRDQRLAIDRRTHCDDHLYLELYRYRRFGIAKRRGLRDTRSPGTATLTWVPPTKNTNGTTPVTPLSGYTIYYGTSASSLTQSVVVSGSTTTSYTITGLASGTWYFAVAADAADGTQSAKSNVGSKTIYNAPAPLE